MGNISEKISWKKILFFQILESGTLDGLITTAFHSCRGTYLETKFLGTYVNNRRLSSITVSWSYNVCVPPAQRKSLGSNLLIKQKLLCCCSSMEHSGKKLKFLKILTEKPRVLLPKMHSTCLEKTFGREIINWFLWNLFNWELRLFNWWWQKQISRVRRSFSSAEWLNFQSISLGFLQKLSAKNVLLSQKHSQGFVKVKFLEKSVFLLNFECKNFAQCCPKREIRVQFFWNKSRKR